MLPRRPDVELDEECQIHVPRLRQVGLSFQGPVRWLTWLSFNIWTFAAASKGIEMKTQRKHSKRRSQDSTRKSTSIDHSRHSRTSTELPHGQMTAEPAELAAIRTDLGMTSIGGPAQSSSPSSSVPESRQSQHEPSRPTSSIDLTKPIITSSAARAANQDGDQEIDLQSEASSDSEDDSYDEDDPAVVGTEDRNVPAKGIVTVNGIEPFNGSETIISERVSVNGRIRPFEPIEAVPALDPALREQIGQVHGGGAIQKWLKKRAEWDDKYAKELAKWRNIREQDRKLAEAHGFLTGTLQGENPPLCSLAGWYDQSLAREVGKSVDEITKKTSGAVMLWMKMSSKVRLPRAKSVSMLMVRLRPTGSSPVETICARLWRMCRPKWPARRPRRPRRAGTAGGPLSVVRRTGAGCLPPRSSPRRQQGSDRRCGKMNTWHPHSKRCI